MFGFAVQPPPPIDVYYDESPIHFGDYQVRVHHTPGHCPGGVCLQIGRKGEAGTHLFVGDTLFAGSIGRTDLPGGNYGVLMRSITGVLFGLGDASIVHPGHGPDTTIGRERQTNPFVLEYLRVSACSGPAGADFTSVARKDALTLVAERHELDPSHAQSIPGGHARCLHAFAVEKSAIRAVEVAHFEPAVRQGSEPAVHARHERRVDDEVGTGGTADCSNDARHDAEGSFGFSLDDGSQNPHVDMVA
jgi:hypothetical protein